MSAAHQRLAAVIAALEQVRTHVEDMDVSEEVTASAYNRWIGMLNGVVEGDWKSLALSEDALPASEMLMHVDAAVAFLQHHLDSGADDDDADEDA